MIKDGSFTKLPTTIDDFFHYWVLFTRPFHNLRNKEMITLAALLKKRYELSEMIKDDALLDMNLLADIHKKAIAEEIGMSSNGVECMLSKLRKTGIIKVPSYELVDLNNISTIWRVDKPLRNDVHPTMKPIALCAKAIVNSSKAGGIVLDLS